MKLHYYIPVEKSSGYTTRNVLKRFNRENFSHELKADFNGNHQLQGYISTQVFRFLFWTKWVVVLDCDNVIDRDRAVEEIRSMDLKYDVMESSPGKFWVIVNYIGSFKKCIRFMETIPGVDRDFIRKCQWDKKIVLRAFPKNGFVPSIIALRSECYGYAGDWFYDFKTWWDHSGTVEWLANHQREMIETQRRATGEARTATQVLAELLNQNLDARKEIIAPRLNKTEPEPKKKLRLIRLEKENE
jgi:hypothetical protein